MTVERRRALRRLEGRCVHLSLVDGSRLDDVALVSVRRTTVWVFANGEDLFLAVDDLIDFWEAMPVGAAA